MEFLYLRNLPEKCYLASGSDLFIEFKQKMNI